MTDQDVLRIQTTIVDVLREHYQSLHDAAVAEPNEQKKLLLFTQAFGVSQSINIVVNGDPYIV